MKHPAEYDFAYIDEKTEHLVKEKQLLSTLNNMNTEQQLLKKELQLKESFKNILLQ
jgi:hypothetical protein